MPTNTKKPQHSPLGVNIPINQHYGVQFTTTARDGKTADQMQAELEYALRMGGIPFGFIRLIRRRR